MGGYGRINGYGRWFIRFDGEDCTNPTRIDSAHHNAEDDTDHQKSTGSKFTDQTGSTVIW